VAAIGSSQSGIFEEGVMHSANPGGTERQVTGGLTNQVRRPFMPPRPSNSCTARISSGLIV
jgi:hypothetical protein